MSSEGNSLTLESDSVFHDEWYFSPPGASEMTVTGERVARKSGVERAERVGERQLGRSGQGSRTSAVTVTNTAANQTDGMQITLTNGQSAVNTNKPMLEGGAGALARDH